MSILSRLLRRKDGPIGIMAYRYKGKIYKFVNEKNKNVAYRVTGGGEIIVAPDGGVKKARIKDTWNEKQEEHP